MHPSVHLAVAAFLALAACQPSNRGAATTDSATHANANTNAAAAVPPPPPASDDVLLARADSGRIMGAPNAPVWVLEVSDFQCPYCRAWHTQTYPALYNEYIKTGKIRFAFVNLPLSFHERAAPAAVAAMCASAQGKFWPMQDALFANQPRWARAADPNAALEQLATESGVDVEQWRACTHNKRIMDLIAADQDRVSHAGARATPSFLVNDQLIEGAVPIAPLRQAIDAALAASKK